MKVEPGILCYLESHISLTISSEDDHDNEASADLLNIWYFTYSADTRNHISGVKAYLDGYDSDGICEFDQQENPWVGVLNKEFKSNHFGGACAYLIILGVNEYAPGQGHFILKQKYDHTHIGHNNGQNGKSKDFDDVDAEKFNEIYEESAKGVISSVLILIISMITYKL